MKLSLRLLFIFTICLAPLVARAAELNFAGKTITLYVGYSPGGVGYDTYARELARYFGKYLPGNPSVVVENRPGAGSMTLTNYIYNSARRDGTEIALIGRGNAADPLIMGSLSAGRFKATDFTWLGSMNNEVSGLFLRTGAPAKDLNDLLHGTPIQVGSTGAGGDQQIFSQALNSMLHMKLHIVAGYPGTNEILLAMDKDELDGIAGYSWAAAKIGSAADLKSGKIKIVLQLGLNKHADLPNVPLVMDLVKSDEDKQALEAIFSRQSMGRPVVAPPNLKPEIATALRQAFDKSMHDPQFIADCNTAQLELNYVSGADVQALVAHVYQSPPGVVAALRQIGGAPYP